MYKGSTVYSRFVDANETVEKGRYPFKELRKQSMLLKGLIDLSRQRGMPKGQRRRVECVLQQLMNKLVVYVMLSMWILMSLEFAEMVATINRRLVMDRLNGKSDLIWNY